MNKIYPSFLKKLMSLIKLQEYVQVHAEISLCQNLEFIRAGLGKIWR